MHIPCWIRALFTPDWLTAIGTVGATITALLLAMGGWIRSWFYHPVLSMVAKVQLPDVAKVRRHLISGTGAIDLGEYYYFRLAISNEGRTAANDVQVFLSRVERMKGNQPEIVTRFTPMNLIWTNTEGWPPKDRVIRSVLLADTPPVYCDLAHVGEPQRRTQPGAENLPDVPADKAVLGLDVQVPTYSNGHLLEPGTYHFSLTLAASNYKTTHYVVEVSFPGLWLSDEQEMLTKGFGMKNL